MKDLLSISCYNCNSTLIKLPTEEILKLDGLNFLCENCGHHNLLKDKKFYKGKSEDPSYASICLENLAV